MPTAWHYSQAIPKDDPAKPSVAFWWPWQSFQCILMIELHFGVHNTWSSQLKTRTMGEMLSIQQNRLNLKDPWNFKAFRFIENNVSSIHCMGIVWNVSVSVNNIEENGKTSQIVFLSTVNHNSAKMIEVRTPLTRPSVFSNKFSSYSQVNHLMSV